MIQFTLPGGNRISRMIYRMFPGFDMFYVDPAQPLATASK